jgi:flagellar biosynthesis/type III secretory pathway protein FliH
LVEANPESEVREIRRKVATENKQTKTKQNKTKQKLISRGRRTRMRKGKNTGKRAGKRTEEIKFTHYIFLRVSFLFYVSFFSFYLYFIPF